MCLCVSDYGAFVLCGSLYMFEDDSRYIRICYDPICNLTHFEAGQPALKRVNPL